jgi:hypothetical protein
LGGEAAIHAFFAPLGWSDAPSAIYNIFSFLSTETRVILHCNDDCAASQPMPVLIEVIEK